MEHPTKRISLIADTKWRSKEGQCFHMTRENNPMLIDVILTVIFGFLNGTDLMNCRFVCSKWKKLSEVFYRRRVQLAFNCKLAEDNSIEKFAAFSKVFSNRRLEKPIPFISVSFQGQIHYKVLKMFFRSRGGQKTKFLSFNNVQILGVEGNPLKVYHLSDRLNLSELNGLRIHSDDNIAEFCDGNATQIVVNTDALKKCKLLFLKRCILELHEKISPMALVVDATFVCATKEALDHLIEMKVEKPTINEFVDFSKMKILLWNDRNTGKTRPRLPIDMSAKNVHLKVFNLERQRYVLNWAQASWTINKLLLNTRNVVLKSQLNVKYLCLDEWVVIDVAAIPKTVEKLVIMGSKDEINGRLESSEELVSLPNLKYLQLWEKIECLELFGNCEKLEVVVLQGFPGNYSTLDVNHIPKSVRQLSMQCVELSSEPGILPLDSLVLQYYTVKQAKNVLKKLRPTNLILDRPFPKKLYYPPFLDVDRNTVIRRRERISNQYMTKKQWKNFYSFALEDIQVQNLIVGPLDDRSILTHMLDNLLKDTEKKCCAFQKENTKVIDYSEFKKFKAFRSSPITSDRIWK